MKTLNKQQEQSRLGQILVKRNLISHEQLSQAMYHQASTGKRLGEILTEWDLINHQHVQAADFVQAQADGWHLCNMRMQPPQCLPLKPHSKTPAYNLKK